MGHLGVTEVVLVLGLLTLIFAERIVRWFARRVARTPASSIPTTAPERSEVATPPEEAADGEDRSLSSGDTGS